MYDFVIFDGGKKKLSRAHQYFGIKEAHGWCPPRPVQRLRGHVPIAARRRNRLRGQSCQATSMHAGGHVFVRPDWPTLAVLDHFRAQAQLDFSRGPSQGPLGWNAP